MSQFTVYKSTDTSAPVLTGQVGKLTNLLGACLVDGYGTKVAAGWTLPNLGGTNPGANKMVFKQGSGSGFHFRVQDDAPVTAKEARLTGYVTMTDVDTGTNPFPTAAQGVSGVAMVIGRKSNTADATARAWIIVADSRTVYVFIATGDSAGAYACFGFGDCYSLQVGDLYNCFVVGRSAENNAVIPPSENLCGMAQGLNSTDNLFFARGYTGLGGSVNCGRHCDYLKCQSAAYTGILPFPNPADGATYLDRVWISDPTTGTTPNIRGRMRGLWVPLHATANFADGDTLVGTGELSGKSFLFIKIVYGGGAAGVAAIETSNTLETN